MRILLLSIALAAVTVAAAAEPTLSMDRLEQTLTVAVLESDQPALRETMARAGELARATDGESDSPNTARAHYLAAMAGFQLMLATMGSLPDMSEIAAAMNEHVDRALELDGAMVEAWLLTAMIRAASLPPTAAVESSREPIEHARELAPDDPRVDVADGITRLYAVGARVRLEAALDGFERHPPDSVPDLWRMQALALLADLCAGGFGGQADLACARHAVDRALVQYPDYAYVREIVAPSLAVQREQSVPAVASERWTELAEDPSGDGRAEGLPDARALSWYHDAGDDTLWFRFDFHDPSIDTANFGVNLFFDEDGDAENGRSWVGDNRDFRFDTVVSVYVRAEGDRYVGVVGKATSAGFFTRRLVDLPDDVRFAVDASGPSVFVGLPRSSFGKTSSIGVLGAVGSSNRFNDDLPRTGVPRIDLVKDLDAS